MPFSQTTLYSDNSSSKKRKDFWLEIGMMKRISEGYCNNIVNMVGCVTLQEPFCLITEFVPYGNLLEYLRSQRKKVRTSQAIRGQDKCFSGTPKCRHLGT